MNSHIRNPLAMTNLVDPISGWQALERPFPNKVFIWDVNGTYVDCLFPNPIHGHFLGGAENKGKRVHDVLSEEAATLVIENIQQGLNDQKPSHLWIELIEGTKIYPVCIRFIPGIEYVIGLVNDYPAIDKCHRPVSQITARPTSPTPTETLLSLREQSILNEVVEGRSNQAIARRLHIKVGTVKYHLTNIYRKLHVTSRVQLVLTASPHLRRLPDWSDAQKTEGIEQGKVRKNGQ